MKKLEKRKCDHGWGVFSKEAVKVGDEILKFIGPFVDITELPKPYTAENDYYLQIAEDLFMGPSGGIDDYVNHCCEPNSGIKFGLDGVKLVAIAPIAAGCQITFDYSTTMHNFDYEMKCACGSSKCRRRVKNFIELPEEIRTKYINLGIVPDYILNALDR